MAQIKRQFVDGKFGQIHLRVATPEHPVHPPLYCMHMSPKSGRSFCNLIEELSDDRIVVASDYPGYGESDPPPAEPPVTIADYAHSIWQVADALGHDTIDLLGHHTGSKVAAEVAHQHQNRVNAIVMISAAILTEEERASFNATYSPIPLDQEGTRFKVMWERINFHRGPGMTLEMMAEALAENLRGGENYEWGHHAAFSYGARFEEILPTLPHRITVMNPADDLFNHTAKAKDYLKNGEVIDLPQWGHGFLDAFPQDVAPLVKKALV